MITNWKARKKWSWPNFKLTSRHFRRDYAESEASAFRRDSKREPLEHKGEEVPGRVNWPRCVSLCVRTGRTRGLPAGSVSSVIV
jgi:hypothetical protein